MSILGSAGQIYMYVLLILLFLGSGFALWSFINSIMNQKKRKTEAMVKKLNQERDSNKDNFIQKTIGGFVMNNNGWLKLAVFSFIGILVSVVVLGFVSTTGTQGANIHQQHQQQGMQQGMGMGSMNMGNMNMGGMSSGMMQDNNMAIQQQLNQMQMQLNQMQQQMGMMNGGMGGMNNMGSMGGSQMQQGMGNMGGMGMMGGMMNMGGMSGSGSMPANSGSGSMSGMGMM